MKEYKIPFSDEPFFILPIPCEYKYANGTIKVTKYDSKVIYIKNKYSIMNMKPYILKAICEFEEEIKGDNKDDPPEIPE